LHAPHFTNKQDSKKYILCAFFYIPFIPASSPCTILCKQLSAMSPDNSASTATIPIAPIGKRQKSSFSEVDWESINTIRVVAADMVQAANSGHPGAPMGCAPLAHVLFTRHLRCDPNDPKWVSQ
jgi:hypothetical protein